jgi:hypothetical protein
LKVSNYFKISLIKLKRVRKAKYMHDPSTVAFEFMWPPKWMKKAFKLPDSHMKDRWILTIWHIDPETDGSDDSCGWFSPKLTNEQRERLYALADEEYDFVIGDKYGVKYQDPAGLVYWCWCMIGNRMDKRKGRKFALSLKEINEVMSLSHNPSDNLRYSVNAVYKGEEKERKEAFRQLLFLIYRSYLRIHRPWYKHPRWHIHHWNFQVHSLQKLKRYLFSRCKVCGGRFPWGYAPSGPWHGTGPLWFRSEVAWHHECDTSKKAVSIDHVLPKSAIAPNCIDSGKPKCAKAKNP